jgi:hypothetical protein
VSRNARLGRTNDHGPAGVNGVGDRRRGRSHGRGAAERSSRGEEQHGRHDQRHRFDSLGTFKFGSLFNLSAAVALYSGKPYTVVAGDLYNNGRSNARPFGIARNTLEGPDYADVDVRWFRDFIVGRPRDGGDPSKLTVGLDAFNVLNRTNYIAYLGTITSPLFGQAVSAQPPRRLQLSLRATF